MKKTIAFALALTLLTCCAACGAQPDTYKALSDTLAAEEYGVGFRNEDVALGLAVQGCMDEMLTDGTAEKISMQWFGRDALLRDRALLEEESPAADDGSLDAVLEKGTLVVGLDDSYPPMGFRDENNEIAGLDIYLANEVARRLGVTAVFTPIDWDAKELELAAGKIDCIWNGMTITEGRLDSMFFARPYVANEQIIIVSDASGIQKKADLAGKKVGLQKGSSSLDALESDPIRAQVASVTEYPDNVSAYTDLKAGRIDALVIDSVVGDYLLAQEKAAQ
ncbi:MAG: transporter substrate-binding domain-containing protein [Clostridia bacterium]|nr:transporter substrate-binding domain-containing protein [Clostridia bacterium]